MFNVKHHSKRSLKVVVSLIGPGRSAPRCPSAVGRHAGPRAGRKDCLDATHRPGGPLAG